MRPGSSDRPLRAAVVGVGHMGFYHAIAYRQIMNIDLVAVVDTDRNRAEKVAGQFETQALTDYRDLFGKVDLVSVAVPTPLHYSVASEFLSKGIPVLIEKPVAPTLREAEELFRIADDKGVVLHVGHVERFNGAVQELQRIVKDPHLIEVRRIGPFASRVAGDHVVLDLMIHDLDIILNLVNEPLTGLGAFGKKVFSNNYDVVAATLQFTSGCLATAVASRVSEHKKRTLAVSQPGAYIFLDYTDQDIHIHRQASSASRFAGQELLYQQASIIEQVFVHKDNPLKLEILHFIDCAFNNGKRMISIDKELKSLEIALKIVDSLDKGISIP